MFIKLHFNAFLILIFQKRCNYAVKILEIDLISNWLKNYVTGNVTYVALNVKDSKFHIRVMFTEYCGVCDITNCACSPPPFKVTTVLNGGGGF